MENENELESVLTGLKTTQTNLEAIARTLKGVIATNTYFIERAERAIKQANETNRNNPWNSGSNLQPK